MYWQFPNTNVRILGSLHVLPANNSGLPSWAVRAFEWAEVLVFESEPQGILPFLRSPSPTNLQNDLTSAAWATLRSLWPTTGPLPSLEEVRPWAALLFSNMLTHKTTQGVEALFMQWASEQSKPVHFLETGEAVAAAFDSAPADEIHKALEMFASDLSAPQRMLEAMYMAWLKGDLPALFEIANQSPALSFAGLKAAVLERRNREWSPALNQLTSTPYRTLVAVGALHLHGPNNVFDCCGRYAQLIPIDS